MILKIWIYYWGRLVFQFEGDRFIGIWGYYDKADALGMVTCLG